MHPGEVWGDSLAHVSWLRIIGWNGDAVIENINKDSYCYSPAQDMINLGIKCNLVTVTTKRLLLSIIKTKLCWTFSSLLLRRHLGRLREITKTFTKCSRWVSLWPTPTPLHQLRCWECDLLLGGIHSRRLRNWRCRWFHLGLSTNNCPWPP